MQYDLNLSGYGTQRIEASGSFFKYVSGLGKIKVTLDNGRSIELVPGQGVAGEKFSGLVVSDRSGVGNPGVLLAGSFDFRDDTVTGTLKTMDGTSLVTADGICFMGSHSAGSSVGVYNFGALLNPAVSGVSVIVTALDVAQLIQDGTGQISGTGGQVELFLAPIVNGIVGNVSGTYCRNKKGGALVSKAQKHSGTAGASGLQPWLQSFGVSVNDTIPLQQVFCENIRKRYSFALTEPLWIPQGWALYFECMATGVPAWAGYEFREEPA